MREFLKGLDLDKETIDSIMAEHGKLITESKEQITELQDKIKTYETEINDLKKSSENNEDFKAKFEELDQKIKQQEADKKAKQEDDELTNTIINSFGDKKFASEYAKNGLIADIKTELSKSENKGKGIAEIVEVLTKDKDGIFLNPNKPKDMPPMGDVKTDITKEDFNKMGYMDRVKFKQDNPEKYEELKK